MVTFCFSTGIRDNNDEVVSATLRALADIVPVLGATTVSSSSLNSKFFLTKFLRRNKI